MTSNIMDLLPLIRRRMNNAWGRRDRGQGGWLGLEMLESRQMLSAPTGVLTASGVTTAGATSYQFTVTYTDPGAQGVNVVTLDSNDIAITEPNTTVIHPTFVSATPSTNGTPITATYQFTPPGGKFNSADNGNYAVALVTNQVSDVNATPNTAAALGNINVNIVDSTPPTASVTAASHVAEGAPDYEFTITYADNQAIDVSTLDDNDVTVTGPNSYSANATFIGVNLNTNGTPRTATYEIPAPGGVFTTDANGTYTITENANQVDDTNGNPVAAGELGTFDINLLAGGPSPNLTANNVNTGGQSTYSFTVKYSDPQNVNVSTLDDNDVTVTGPNGYTANATFVSVNINTNGTPRTATYQIPAPGGIFTTAANGTYTVTMNPNQVADVGGATTAAGSLGTFRVNIPTTPPTTTLTAPDLTTSGQSTYSFTVRYADQQNIDVSTLDSNDLIVSGPNGYSAPATFISVNINTNGTPRTATYQIAGPDGGNFTPVANGTYTVMMRLNQVADINGVTAVAGSIGTFDVNVPPSSVRPTGAATAADVTATTPGNYQFTVTYTGENPINATTLDNTDITVTSPTNSFSENATFVSAAPPLTNTSPIVATYSIPAPGSGFVFADNGTYTINVNALRVRDTQNLPVAAGSVGTFNVIVPSNVPPTGVATAANVTTTAPGNYQFTVTYTGQNPIDVSSLGAGDITVTSPTNSFTENATFVSSTPSINGSPITATYTIPAPGNGFVNKDNGTYTIRANPSQVKDTNNLFMAAGSIGTFNVTVPVSSVPPTGVATAANVITTTPGNYQFTVTYTGQNPIDVSTLGAGDITVTSPTNNFSENATFVSSTPATNGSPIVATYTIPAPGSGFLNKDDGTYTINANASQVKDTNNLSVAAGSLGTFIVNVPASSVPPTGVATAEDVTATTPGNYQFTVTYTGENPIDVSSLGNTDITVTSPTNSFSQAATFVSSTPSVNGSPIVATYTIPAPGSGFVNADDGVYTINANASEVKDTDNRFVAAGPLGTFDVNVPDLGTTLPSGVATAADVTATTPGNYQFTVTYTDPGAIKVSTLDNNDVKVLGPNGFDQAATFVSASPNTNGSPIVATYTIPAPGNGFVNSDNGTYTIHVNGIQVGDIDNNFVEEGPLGTFNVNVPPSSVPPTGVATAENVTTTTPGNYGFTVTFTGENSIDVTTLGNTDITVTSPTNNFSENATFVSSSPSINGSPIVAIYTIPAPGSGFVNANNGTYTIHANAGEVKDTNNLAVAAGSLGTFAVNVPASSVAPTGVATAADVTATTPGNYQFTVTFTGENPIDVSTLGNANITVTSPTNSFSENATFVSSTPSINGSPIIATYSIPAPGSGFVNANNGAYTINENANQVKDAQGLAVAAGSLGTFNVNVPPSSVAPTAVATAADVTATTPGNYQFTVTYTGENPINVSTLGNSDISVTSPTNSFNRTATFVSSTPSVNGSPIIATYSISTPIPGNGFTNAGNGTYTIFTSFNAVADTNNNFVASAQIGTFNVNVPPSSVPPTGVATADNVIATTPGNYSFEVTYTGENPIDVSTLGNANITVIGPENSFSEDATFVESFPSTNGSPIRAFYTIPAPGNGFVNDDNGAYAIHENTDQVADTNGNFVPAGQLGAFVVSVPPSSVPPTGVADAADVTATTPGNYEFTVTYTGQNPINIATLGNTDITVTSPTNSFSENATFVSVTPATNGSPRVATYTIPAPGNGFVNTDNGTYTINENTNEVFDTNELSVAAGPLGTFAVNVPLSNVPPTGVATASNVTTTTPGNYEFTVTYTGANPIDVATLDNTDITVTSPTNSFSEGATFVSSTPSVNGTPIMATYTIPAPGSGFVFADNGTYTIHANTDQVKDTNNLAVAAGSLGTFTVNVPASNVAPTGVATAADVTATTPGDYQFTVTFTGENPIDVSTLGDTNITVTSPTDNFSEAATFVSSAPSVNGSPIVATYTIPAPGNGFVNGNNGTYTINENTDEVADTNSNFVAAGPLGTFNVDVPLSNVAPTGVANAPNVTETVPGNYEFTVTYTGENPINVSTLGNTDITVTSPTNSFSQNATFVSSTPSVNGSPITATYTIPAPGNGFVNADNGTYTIHQNANEVKDTNNLSVATGSLGTFTVNVPVPADTTVPTGVATAPNVTATTPGTYQFTVTYTDDTAINVATLDNSDITVTSPTNSFSQAATFVSSTPSVDGSPITATYTIPAPGSGFVNADNGVYTIHANASQVADTSGNVLAAGALGTFSVDVPAVDTTLPTGVATASNVTTTTPGNYQFTVTYTDAAAINVSTLDSSDVNVLGPNGFNQGAAFVSSTPSVNGSPIIATYTIPVPGNGFVNVNNGTYTINANPIQVADTNNNFVAAGSLGTFNVNVSLSNVAPTGVATASNVTTTTPGNYHFTVTFTGENPIDVSTLGNTDITVTSPTNSFSENATFVSSTPSANGSPIIATYTIPAPGNGFVNADNGTYTIHANANEVKDTNNLAVATGSLGTFAVNVPASSVAPIGAATAADVTTTTPGTYQFTVTFTGENPIDVSTLGNTDITVTSPTNSFSQAATFVSSTPSVNGSPITATYTIPAPGSGFVNADNGVYTINANATEVKDTNNLAVAAGSLGTFNVDVPEVDTTLPTGVATAANVTATTPGAYQFTVTYTDAAAIDVSTLDSNDVNVLGPNGFDQAATFVSSSPSVNGSPIIATYTIPAPGSGFVNADNGVYTIDANGIQVADTNNNFVAAGSMGTFNVNVPLSNVAPTGVATAADVTATEPGNYQFTVTYAGANPIDVSTLGNTDITVTSPTNNFSENATFVSVNTDTNGTPRTATYTIPAPGNGFLNVDNGTYTIHANANEVKDTNNLAVAAGSLGTFAVNVPPSNVAPTGVATAADVTTTTPGTYEFTVTFTGENPIDVSTLGNTNISVTSLAKSFGATATFVSSTPSVNGSPITATYTIPVPGSGFVTADNGTYTIIENTEEVADTNNNFVAAGLLGTFNVNVPAVAPTAVATAADVTTTTPGNYQFTVTYTDDTAINVSTLDSNDITVTSPTNNFGEEATFVSSTPSINGSPIVATYTIPVPGNGFVNGDNGTYTINENTGEVADTDNNFVAAGPLGTFNVNVPLSNVAPTGVATAPDVTETTPGNYQFTVTYTGANPIDVSTLGDTDITVTSPTNSFSENATFVSSTPSINGSPIVAIYTIPAPDDGFVNADNGTYTIHANADEVKDTNNLPVATGSLGTFTVDVPAVADTTAPTGVATAVDVTTTTPGVYPFTVTFTDDTAIDVATLGDTNITVTSPTNDFSEQATFVRSIPSTNGSPITAIYTIPAPGDGFLNVDNGTYTINENTDEVADTSSNFVAAGPLGTFAVNVPASDVAPTGVADAANVTATTPGTYQFTVIFTGENPIDVSTLGNTDITVTSPTNSFSENATFVSSAPSVNGSPIVATYTIPVPGSGFVNADNGTYTINANANEVKDTNNLPVAAGPLGTFDVNVPVAADTTPPTAAINSAFDVTTTGATTYQFTVTYADDTAVAASTLGDGDVNVLGPNGFNQAATFVSVDTNTDGTPRTVTYQITAPGGTFNPLDNGAYVIKMNANQVEDTNGNPVAPGVLGSFQVEIPVDNVMPTAALTAANVTTSGAGTYQFTVTYSDNTAIDVSTLDSSDVHVVGPNGFNQAATFVSVNTDTNGTPRTATYQITAPGGTFDTADNGLYAVVMNADQVDDTSGNAVAAGSLGNFTVNVQPATLFGNVAGQNLKTSLTDRDGTVVTFAIKGPGAGSVTNDGVGFVIQLTGTTTATSVTITTKKSKNKGDDGRAIIDSVTIGNDATPDSVGTFTATTSDLRGPIVANGTLTNLKIGNLYDNASVQILDHGATGSLINLIQAGIVTDASITSADAIKSLTVAAWTDRTAPRDIIMAPSIATLTSKGDFNADVTLTMPGVQDLGKLSVTGLMNDAIFRSISSVGTITVGAMRDSAFYVGVDDSVTGLPAPDQIAPNNTLNSLTIKGLKTEAFSFVNSFIAADTINTIKLTTVDVDNDGDIFGVEANTVNSYTRGSLTLKNLTMAGDADGLADYVLRIV